MNLSDLIARNAAFAPEKDAIRYDGRALSYAAFADRIGRTAAVLAHDLTVGAGDRVAILALNHPDTLVLLYACARLGAMLVPLNWRLAGAELAYIVGDADPAALVVGPDFAEHGPALAAASPAMRILALEEGVDPSLDALIAQAAPMATGPGRLSDPLLVVYTSGTTGWPKGAVLTQDALLANAAMSRHMHGLAASDHVLAVLPFFHVGGLNIQTTPALQAGARVTIHPRFAPDRTLAAIAADRPTMTVLVPATLSALLAEPGFADADLSSLRAVATGSTFVPQPLVDALEARCVPVLQVYGATETAPIAIYTRHGGPRPRPGSTGWPGPLCEAKVVDATGTEVPTGRAGEVWVRGPQVFSGYWRDPVATAAALAEGWFRTGDIGVRDPDGAFTILDREKNLIISGGENIYPAEIERVLLAHPAVQEAAVIGRPDARWGEVPVAHVVIRSGRTADAADLAAYVLAEIARFKAPRTYVFVDTLPKSALGKVQHHLLRGHP